MKTIKAALENTVDRTLDRAYGLLSDVTNPKRYYDLLEQVHYHNRKIADAQLHLERIIETIEREYPTE